MPPYKQAPECERVRGRTQTQVNKNAGAAQDKTGETPQRKELVYSMIVCVDESGCIGCGLCVSTCPEVFEIGANGLARTYQQPEPAQEETARMAAENCPVSVIHLEE